MTDSLFCLILFFCLTISFLSVNWIYFKILKIAKKKDIVDNIEHRKLQKEPVPVMGGIAVFFGWIAGIAIYLAWGHGTEGEMTSLAVLICSLVLMLYFGAMDDAMGLSPLLRAVMEMLVMLIIIKANGCYITHLGGLWGVQELSPWTGVPLTVVSGVGIINAINMIDGVNGLSSGMCIVCGCIFGTVFLLNGDQTNAVLAYGMAASLLPFLLHNVFGKTSKMFIGDAGTMVMGLLMTWFTISLLSKDPLDSQIPTNYNMVAFALAVLSVPVFDTLRVMTVRMVNGRSPFSPDKGHLHHLYIAVGVSHLATALCEIASNVLIVGCWWITAKNGASADVQLYVVICAALLLVWGMYAFLFYHAKHNTAVRHWLERHGVSRHLGQTSWWLKIRNWLDAPSRLR